MVSITDNTEAGAGGRVRVKAQKPYREKQVENKRGPDIKNRGFKSIAHAFLARLEDKVNEGVVTRVKLVNTRSKYLRYYIPYFGQTPVDEIYEADIMAYKKWRENYSASNPTSKANTESERLDPSILHTEVMDLRFLLLWSYIDGR